MVQGFKIRHQPVSLTRKKSQESEAKTEKVRKVKQKQTFFLLEEVDRILNRNEDVGDWSLQIPKEVEK